MKSGMRALALVALATALFASPAVEAARRVGGTMALVNVRVVSMDPADRKAVKKRQTVIVEDGRIVEIGSAKSVAVPEGAEVVNGKNKLYVLPGLADLHIHNHGIPDLPENVTPEDIYTMYFANGITTVLDMAGFKEEFKWRRDIDRGRVVGPDLRFTSPTFDVADYASPDAME